MLRPTDLLSVHDLRRFGLSTPRFTSQPLGLKWRSATGRSGAYPDGTLTRWNRAA
jgi:hypothetical protein